jgi:hypothetical protein
MNRKSLQILYQLSLIIPIILGVLGVFALFIYRRDLDNDDSWIGITITVTIISIMAILIGITIKILQTIKIQISPLKHNISIHTGFSAIALGIIIFSAWMVDLSLSAVHYDISPIVVWSTDQDPTSSITILWRTRTLETSIVHYGPDPQNLQYASSIAGDTEWHKVPLINLSPNTTYYYRVEGRLANQFRRFTTAPSTVQNFTFLLFADTRENSGMYASMFQPNVPKIMANTMEKLRLQSAFSIVCGDITSNAYDIITWKAWFTDISTGIGASAPVQVTIGNHERHDNATGEIFQQFYPYTNRPGFYYSYNYSNIHIIALDPFNVTTGWWDSLSVNQLAWLEADLQRAENMTYKIVTMHPPPVRYGKINNVYAPLIALCDQYQVDAVFYGHAHGFEVNTFGNTTYFLIGVGGNGSVKPSGFCQVDVSTIEMSIYMHWTNGTTQFLNTIFAN